MSNTIDSQILSNRARAERARDEVVDKVEQMEGVISVIGEGEDYVELVALRPSDMVEGTEWLGDTEIEIVNVHILPQ